MSEGSSSFFQIPGNIKQQFLPFVLIPDAPLHKTVNSSPNVSGSPQYFTYRNTNITTSSGVGQLQFLPYSVRNIHFKDDISYKLLYGPDFDESKSHEKKEITFQDILNKIPGVQIREFLPDTRLDQCINVMTDMFKNMTKLFSNDDDQGTATETNGAQTKKNDSVSDIAEKIMKAAWYTMKYMVGAVKPDFINDLGSISGTEFTSYNKGFMQGDVAKYVMKFPFALYYRLQSCVTTNIYEVPAITSDKMIMKSNGGMAGWTSGGDDFMSSGGLRLSGILGKIPVVGTLANMILGNIGINYMPWWNAKAGADGQKEAQVEIKFDLFNDNASYENISQTSSSMINFIFVNTLVPNNKWVQYNMFQHSQNLYDVKIEGVTRLFACAGDFTVTYDGVLREPSSKWIDTFVKKFANNNMNKEQLKTNIMKNHLIKIPDVYHVTMQFQSLLPANFNNYLFTYAENANHIETYKDKVYDQSALAEALPNAMNKYTKRVIAVFKNNDEAAGANAC